MGTIMYKGESYGGGGGGGSQKELLYTLTAGGQWESFTVDDPNEMIEIEARNGDAVTYFRVHPSQLPSRASGDNYTSLGYFPNWFGGATINVGQVDDGETVYISASDVYDTSIYSVKVWQGTNSGATKETIYLNPTPYTFVSPCVTSKAVSEFDYIIVSWGLYDSSYNFYYTHDMVYDTSTICKLLSQTVTPKLIGGAGTSASDDTSWWIVDPNGYKSVYFENGVQNWCLNKIVGVKL